MSSDAIATAYVRLRPQPLRAGEVTDAVQPGMTRAAEAASNTVRDKLHKGVRDGLSPVGATALGATLGTALGLGVVRAAEKVKDFASESIDAFARAERSSTALDVSLAKFPRTADLSREAYDKLAASIQRKTRFDDDSASAAEAVLAGFDLTGKQITELLPKVADLATKTGTDLPTAARTAGLALEGQTRALKGVGIVLGPIGAESRALKTANDALATSTSTLAAKKRHLADLYTELSAKTKLTTNDQVRFKKAQDDVRAAEQRHAEALTRVHQAQQNVTRSGSQFAQVSAGLSRLQGAAAADAQTSAGKLDQLHNNYENLQESVGQRLVPALTGLVDFTNADLLPAFQATTNFLGEHSVLAVGIGAVAGGFLTLKLAMAGVKSVQTLLSDFQTIFIRRTAASTVAIEAEGAAAATAAGQIELLNAAEAGGGVVGGKGGKGRGIGKAVGGLFLGTQLAELYKSATGHLPKDELGDIDKLFGGSGLKVKQKPKAKAAESPSLAGLGTLIGGALPAGPSSADFRRAEEASTKAVKKVGAAVAKKGGKSFADLFNLAGKSAGDSLAAGLSSKKSKVQSAVDGLTVKLQPLKDAITSLQGDRDQLSSTIQGTFTGASALSNSLSPTARGVSAFLGRQLASDQTFARNLQVLQAKHLSSTLLSQIAQLGPDRGFLLAGGLAAGSAKEIARINRLTGQIDKLGGQVGEKVAQTVYSPQLDKLNRQLADLRHDVQRVGADVAKAMNHTAAHASTRSRTKTGTHR